MLWRYQRARRKQTWNKLGLGIGIPLILIAICFTSIFVIAKRRYKNKGNATLENGNPENEVQLMNLISQEHGKDEFVNNGVAAQVSGKLLYVVGKLGNSVSTTGKDIVQTFAREHKMKPCYYHYLDIPKEFPPETVNFIDGWCGLWNYNPCEMQDAKNKLNKIISYGKHSSLNVKFVIGIRTDVKQELRKKKINFPENETLLLDTFSKSKQENVAKKLELTKANCSNDTCRCKSLAIKNIMGISYRHIGTPLIVNLMDIDHRMIQGFLNKETGPMEAIKSHIKDMQSNYREFFNFLLYIVVVGYYDQREFNDEFAQAFDVAKDCFENYASMENLQKYTKTIKKSKLASMWCAKLSKDNNENNSSRTVHVFWHNFLYICAFHVCFESHPDKMMRICNIDALLQLLRPRGWKRDWFTVEIDTTSIDIIHERVQGTPVESKWSEHPLIKYRTPERRNFSRRKTH